MNIISEDTKAKAKKKREADHLKAVKDKAMSIYFDAEKQEVKSLKEILEKTIQVRDVFVPVLGCKVKIGHINMLEFSEIMGIDDENKRAMDMLFRLMHSGDPAVTKKDIQALPFQITTAIIKEVMGGGMGFPEGPI